MPKNGLVFKKLKVQSWPNKKSEALIYVTVSNWHFLENFCFCWFVGLFLHTRRFFTENFADFLASFETGVCGKKPRSLCHALCSHSVLQFVWEKSWNSVCFPPFARLITVADEFASLIRTKSSDLEVSGNAVIHNERNNNSCAQSVTRMAFLLVKSTSKRQILY